MNKLVLPFVACAIAATLVLVAFVARGESTAVSVPRAPRTVVGAVESPPTAHAAGVMVNAPLRSSTPESEELAFYGTFSRTRLAVELVYPAGGLFELDREASVVTSFADDLGTNLIDPEDHFGPLEMMPRIAEGGRSMLFVVGSKVLPARDAGRLRAEGTLVLRVALERVQFASESVAFEKGGSIVVGPYTFEVTEFGESQWGEGWSTTLVTREDPGAILSWTLVDEDGTEHEWSSTMSMSGGGSWHKTLQSDVRLDRAVVRVEAWKDPKLEKVPFAVEAGLGLQ